MYIYVHSYIYIYRCWDATLHNILRHTATLHIFTHTHTHKHTLIYIYIYSYAYIYMYMYVYRCIHTHIYLQQVDAAATALMKRTTLLRKRERE